MWLRNFYLLITLIVERNTKAGSVLSKVTGGWNAQEGEIPYQIKITTYSSTAWFCGGSLIDERHVLTAAHCILGEVDIEGGFINEFQPGENYFKVKNNHCYMHEDYNDTTVENDIALIRVNGNIQFNDYVKSIELRPETVKESICTISGWGYRDPFHVEKIRNTSKKNDGNLQVATMPLVDFDVCKNWHIMQNSTEKVVPGMLCAGYEEGRVSGCNGDSGGPLVCDGLLTGIVSWGTGCGRPKSPTVFADVAYYYSWIQEAKKKNFTGCTPH